LKLQTRIKIRSVFIINLTDLFISGGIFTITDAGLRDLPSNATAEAAARMSPPPDRQIRWAALQQVRPQASPLRVLRCPIRQVSSFGQSFSFFSIMNINLSCSFLFSVIFICCFYLSLSFKLTKETFIVLLTESFRIYRITSIRTSDKGYQS